MKVYVTNVVIIIPFDSLATEIEEYYKERLLDKLTEELSEDVVAYGTFFYFPNTKSSDQDLLLADFQNQMTQRKEKYIQAASLFNLPCDAIICSHGIMTFTGTGMVTTYLSMVLEESLPTPSSPGPTGRERFTSTMTRTGRWGMMWVCCISN